MKPVHFRLYPHAKSGLYVMVNVWPTRKEMLAQWGEGRGAGRTCQGFCSPIHVTDYSKGRARKQPIVAEVHLWRDHLSMMVVTHELFHASLAWARRVGFDFGRLDDEDSINRDEERLTYAHSNMCSDFMVRANRAKLYDHGLSTS